MISTGIATVANQRPIEVFDERDEEHMTKQKPHMTNAFLVVPLLQFFFVPALMVFYLSNAVLRDYDISSLQLFYGTTSHYYR